MREMKDPRSTGRRRARKELFNNYISYECVDCGVTSAEPPKDAPSHFTEIWPEANRTLKCSLQADHESKDMESNDISQLNWRCPSCHKKHDLLTGKGVSTVNTSIWADDEEADSEPTIGIW